MNELEKNIVKWQSRASKRREDGVFIVEGTRMFTEVPAARLQTIVVSEDLFMRYPEMEEEVRRKREASHAGLRTVKPDVFRKLSDTQTPQGILAVVRITERTPEEVLSDSSGLYVILENLQDPGNLGTILRSCEAAGASGVIMNTGCADIWNPKVVRATMGAIFRVPFTIVPDLRDTVRMIHERGGECHAAHLRGAVPYDVPDYRGMSAFMIGNEGEGLTPELTALADRRIIIPMKGAVESLNAAMAATILLFEAARQRQ